MAKFRPPPLSLAQQYMALKNEVAGDGELSHKYLRWSYVLRPTPLSREYRLLLTYQQNESPHVYVVDPDLKELSGDRRIPHLYDHEKIRVCLYLPGVGEWNRYMYLRDTLIPWSSLWLFYYEEWLYSDEWKGGGIHPDTGKRIKSKKKKKRR